MPLVLVQPKVCAACLWFWCSPRCVQHASGSSAAQHATRCVQHALGSGAAQHATRCVQHALGSGAAQHATRLTCSVCPRFACRPACSKLGHRNKCCKAVIAVVWRAGQAGQELASTVLQLRSPVRAGTQVNHVKFRPACCCCCCCWQSGTSMQASSCKITVITVQCFCHVQISVMKPSKG